MRWYGLDWSGWRWGSVEVSCERGKEYSGSKNIYKFLTPHIFLSWYLRSTCKTIRVHKPEDQNLGCASLASPCAHHVPSCFNLCAVTMLNKGWNLHYIFYMFHHIQSLRWGISPSLLLCHHREMPTYIHIPREISNQEQKRSRTAFFSFLRYLIILF
jgi:hypothetical protein